MGCEPRVKFRPLTPEEFGFAKEGLVKSAEIGAVTFVKEAQENAKVFKTSKIYKSALF